MPWDLNCVLAAPTAEGSLVSEVHETVAEMTASVEPDFIAARMVAVDLARIMGTAVVCSSSSRRTLPMGTRHNQGYRRSH